MVRMELSYVAAVSRELIRYLHPVQAEREMHEMPYHSLRLPESVQAWLMSAAHHRRTQAHGSVREQGIIMPMMHDRTCLHRTEPRCKRPYR